MTEPADDTVWQSVDVADLSLSGKLDDVIAALQRLRDGVPEEHRASAEIEVDAELEYWAHDDSTAVLRIEVGYGRALRK